MAGGGVNRKISAASARAHTRKAKQTTSFNLPSGLFTKILLVLSVGALAWAFQAINPPPPKICGSPDGPPVTASRIKLRDGRHLAYQERGVPRDAAKYKIVEVHGFYSCRFDTSNLSQELVERLGVYIVSFDRPGYGESDPNPTKTVKSIALDIEELADQLRLGSKFYVIGFSMGGEVIWSCLKYIPHRLAGATLIAPVINYWWSGLPTNLTNQAYLQQLLQDQWALRVSHYAPWLTYWWNTQKWFPGSSVIATSIDNFSSEDIKLLMKIPMKNLAYSKQQGEYESLHRDMIIGFQFHETFLALDICFHSRM
ncbi:germin-like protein subfamily 3 member 2-like [Hibiscus syriacus]|uniref:Germin-like protein subfamily 3 member 2-like n=1 Tax=Hibiscus syriacus TaxID=106335 RepID=A0A6A2Z060_HIBSY|nr:germin-like protein subfamily 3 member 2-like [Hibiscus syriacus]